MGTAIGTGLVLLALAVLIYPLIKRRRELTRQDPALGRSKAERRRIYGLIADLDASRAAGEVTEADYRAQLDELRVAAARTLQQEAATDRPEAGTDAAKLEGEIEAARQSRRRSGQVKR